MRNLWAVTILALALSACSKGGQLTLEPGARIVKNKSKSMVIVNQGGKALVVEQGQTATTGINGWVGVQTQASPRLTSPDGHSAILNTAIK